MKLKKSSGLVELENVNNQTVCDESLTLTVFMF